MKLPSVFATLALLTFSAACSMQSTVHDSPPPEHNASPATVKSTVSLLDELIDYGLYYEALSDEDQQREREKLQQTPPDEDGLINRLQRALVLSLSPSYTDISSAIELLRTSLEQQEDGTALWWLTSYQHRLLLELQEQIQTQKILERRIAVMNRRQQELEAKLEALTVIEKSIHERKGGHNDANQ